MKIIGFSSGVTGRNSNVDRMVKAIMEKSGYEAEFVKLTDLNYSACKGCSWLCAKPQQCMLEDDLLPFFEKVKKADAVVLGSAIQMNTVNATMLSFLSRFFGFRHITIAIKNKPFVLALCGLGGLRGKEQLTAEHDFKRVLMPYQVNIIDTVTFRSKIPPCFSCGCHQECRIGGAYKIWGEKAHTMELTQKLFRQWEDDIDTKTHIDEAAKKLKSFQ